MTKAECVTTEKLQYHTGTNWEHTASLDLGNTERAKARQPTCLFLLLRRSALVIAAFNLGFCVLLDAGCLRLGPEHTIPAPAIQLGGKAPHPQLRSLPCPSRNSFAW